MDSHRSEIVCEGCGVAIRSYVLMPDENFFIDNSFEELPENDGLLRKEENRIIAKSRYDRFEKNYEEDPEEKKDEKFIRPSTAMREWRINQYYICAKRVGKELKMTRKEIKRVQTILYSIKLKDIHSCLKYEALITGICLYVLRSKGYVVSYRNDFVKGAGLTALHYKVIKRNLDRLNVLEM